MKQHITRKEVRNASYTAVILCDEIQNIAYLCGISPEYYNAGGCGWNWDLYDLDGVAVVGGYRSFPACMARICRRQKDTKAHPQTKDPTRQNRGGNPSN